MVSKTYKTPYYRVSSVFCHFLPTKSRRRTQHAVDFSLLEEKQSPVLARTGPEGSGRFRAPRFQDSPHMKVVRLSALRTGRLYHPGNTLGTHFCQRLNRAKWHSATGRIGL
jgi:hypothetical protein